jgi:acetyltransferase-like isoleucine patch superfamily enzyme
MGFSKLGENVLIDKSVILIGINRITIGSNVRIDTLSMIITSEMEIFLGSGVHIGAGAKLFGSAGITMGSYSAISAGVSIFSQSDDYSSGALTNLMAPIELRNVTASRVEIMPYAVVGANSVILPGVVIGKGASVGALSLVNRFVPEFDIVTGNPIRRIGIRGSKIINEHESGITDV